MTLSLSISNVECETCTTGSSSAAFSGAPYVSGPVQVMNPNSSPVNVYQIPNSSAIWGTPIIPEQTHVIKSVQIMSADPEDISVGLYVQDLVVPPTYRLLTKATFGPTPFPAPTFNLLEFPQEVTITSDNVYLLLYSYQGAGNPPTAPKAVIFTIYPGLVIPASGDQTGLTGVWTAQITDGILPETWIQPGNPNEAPGFSYFALGS